MARSFPLITVTDGLNCNAEFYSSITSDQIVSSMPLTYTRKAFGVVGGPKNTKTGSGIAQGAGTV